MFDLILSYIFTILISYGIDFLIVKEVINIIFDNGYKIVVTTDSKFDERLNEITKSSKIIKLIPIINIFNSVIGFSKIKNNMNFAIDSLSAFDMLEEMNDEEKEKYNNKPTFFTGMIISIDSKKNSKYLSVTRLKDGSVVYSKYVNNEIHIDTTGPISKLKNKEQIKVILEEIQNTDTNSPLKDMFIEEEIISKKSKLILRLEKLRNALKKHIDELETEEQKNKQIDNQKIKKL